MQSLMLFDVPSVDRIIHSEDCRPILWIRNGLSICVAACHIIADITSSSATPIPQPLAIARLGPLATFACSDYSSALEDPGRVSPPPVSPCPLEIINEIARSLSAGPLQLACLWMHRLLSTGRIG